MRNMNSHFQMKIKRALNSNFVLIIRALATLTLFISVMSLISCAPRGESKSLDEIYVESLASFKEVISSGEAQGVKSDIDKLTLLLNNLTSATSQAAAAQASKEAGDILTALSRKANYTSRAAMRELATQLETFNSSEMSELSFSKDKQAAAGMSASKAKLLAARTYQALTLELSGTKFKFKS